MEIIDHECYVSSEVAKLLKEAGFDWDCRKYYPSSFMACRYEEYAKPTFDVAQRWLREVKNIQIIASPLSGSKKWTPLIAKDFWLLHEDIIGIGLTSENFDTYELALEAGIKKALEIILEKDE